MLDKSQFIRVLKLGDVYTNYRNRGSAIKDTGCPACYTLGKDIFKNIKQCPHCGTQYKLTLAKQEILPDIDYLKDLNVMMAHVIGKYLVKDSSALEVGCAYGDLLHTIQQNYTRNVTGLDLVNIVRENYLFPMRILSLEDVHFSREFDAIIMVHVIEHLKNPNWCLSRLNKFLKDNGKIFIFTNEADNFPFGCIEDLVKQETHQQIFTEQGFEHLAVQNDFKVVEFVHRWDYQIFCILEKR